MFTYLQGTLERRPIQQVGGVCIPESAICSYGAVKFSFSTIKITRTFNLTFLRVT